MLRGAIIGMFALAGLGCGAEPSYAEFGEVCGEAGPVRVLELGPGERLNAPPLKFGDRVVYAVGRATPEDARASGPANQVPLTVWATGPCGEAPRRIAEGVTWAFSIAPLPGVLLACDAAAGELLVLDPEGGAPPHVLATMDCNSLHGWTAHGLLSVTRSFEEGGEDSGLATLQLHRFPADLHREVAETVTLLDTMRTLSRRGQSIGQILRVFPEFVFAVTPEDELVRVDLDDGAVTVVQTGVAAFVADGVEDRYVLWQDLTPTNDDPERMAGKLFLRDRSDSSDVFVGEGVLAYSGGALRHIERGVFFVYLESIRMFSLPDLGFTDLPPLGQVDLMIDERRVLMDHWGLLNVVDLVSGAVTTLYNDFGQIERYREDGVEVLALPICCAGGNTQRDEGPLWFIPYEGTARHLTARATRFGRTFADGRRVDTVDIGGDWRGVLQLSDPGTGEALRIDEGVFAQMYVAGVFGENVVTYSIPEGERAGVWIAKMPPVSQE